MINVVTVYQRNVKFNEEWNMSESKYEKEYSEESFWDKITKTAKSAGVKVIYAALLLYYVLKKPNIPMRIKAVIYGALGYFVSPLDAILDITPVIGYSDDLGVLVLALTVVSAYIDQEVKNNAKSKLEEWFGEDACDSINSINSSI